MDPQTIKIAAEIAKRGVFTIYGHVSGMEEPFRNGTVSQNVSSGYNYFDLRGPSTGYYISKQGLRLPLTNAEDFAEKVVYFYPSENDRVVKAHYPRWSFNLQ